MTQGERSHRSEAIVVACRLREVLLVRSVHPICDHVRVHLDVLFDVDGDLGRLHPFGDFERLVESATALLRAN